MRLDAFIGPGHVSTVIGCRPYEWIAQNEGKPIVVSGFEPLDILQSIVMLLRQLKAGEPKVENQYKRVVPWEGNRAALRAMAEVFELRPYFEWRGLGFISQSALRIRDSYAEWDAEQRFSVPGVRVTDPKAAQCGEVLKGVLKPAQCKLFGKECTPEHPIGALMVSSEGSCAAYYNYEHRKAADAVAWRRPAERPMRARPYASIPRSADRNGARRRRQGQPPADRRSVCAAPVRLGAGNRWATPRYVEVNGTGSPSRPTASWSSPLRFPGGSIGELAVNGTVNDLAVSGAQGGGAGRHLRARGGLAHRRSGSRSARHGRGRAARRRDHRGRRYQSGRARQGRRHVHHDGRHRPPDSRRACDRRARCARATRCCSPAPSAITASRFCWRAASWIWKPIFAPIRVRCCRWWRRWRDAAGPGIRWMRDPTRGGVATSLNELARDCGLAIYLREDQIPVRDAVRGACELARPRSAAHRQRRPVSGRGRAGVCRCRARRAAADRRAAAKRG